MADKIRGITIELSGDTSKLVKSLDGVNKEINSNKRSLRDLEKALKLDPKNTELLEQKQALLNDTIGKTQSKLKGLKEAQEQAKKEMEGGSEEGKKAYDLLTRDIATCENELKKLGEQSKKTNEELKRPNTEGLEKFGKKAEEVGNKVSSIGKGLSVVSAGVVALGTASVQAFNEVDEGADSIIKITGAVGEQGEALQKSYEKVATSVVGSFEDIGKAIGTTSVRFGVQGEELESLTTEFIKFASITGQDSTTAIEGISRAMRMFGVDSSQAQNVMGMLVKTAQNTGISVSTLYSNLRTSGVALQEMGLGLTESINLMASFESAGIDSSNMLTKMTKAATYFSKNGKDMNEGLSDLITRLQDSSTQAKATEEAYSIFGTKAGLQFVTFAKQGKISLNNLDADMEQFKSVVSDTYEATLDGSDEVQLSWQKAKLSASKLGEVLDSKLGKIAEKVGKKIEELSEWFEGLNEEQVETIIKVGAIVASIGPLLIITGKLITSIKAISTALTFLSAHPMVAMVGALAGLITTGVIYTKIQSEQIRNTDYLTEAQRKNVDAMKESIDSWDALVEASEEANTQTLTERDNLIALWEQLKNITDENGKVKEGCEERAKVISEQLNEALHTNLEYQDGIVKGMKEEASAIDTLIQRKTVEALLEQNKAKYLQALADERELQDNLVKTYNEYMAVQEKLAVITPTYLAQKKELDDQFARGEIGIGEYTNRLKEIGEEYNTLTGRSSQLSSELEKGASTYGEAEKTIEGYNKLLGLSADSTADDVQGAINQFLDDTSKAKNDFQQIGTDIIADASKSGEGVSTAFASAMSSGPAWVKLSKAITDVKNKTAEIDQSDKSGTWGDDLSDNYSTSLWKSANKEGGLFSVVNRVAQKIKDVLGFSEPKEGPLSNFHTYAPDMMKLYAKGIQDEKWRVLQEAQGLAGELQYTFGNFERTANITNNNNIILDGEPIANAVNRQLGLKI